MPVFHFAKPLHERLGARGILYVGVVAYAARLVWYGAAQSGWLLPGLESLASGAQQHSSAVRICRACCSRHLPRAVRLQFTN